MNTFSSWDEVPLFDREEAEAAFWAENRPDLRLMEAAVVAGTELADSVTITLRIDPRMLSKIKRLARSRFLNYQSMINEALRTVATEGPAKLETDVRRVIREELKRAGEPRRPRRAKAA